VTLLLQYLAFIRSILNSPEFNQKGRVVFLNGGKLGVTWEVTPERENLLSIIQACRYISL